MQNGEEPVLSKSAAKCCNIWMQLLLFPLPLLTFLWLTQAIHSIMQ